MSKRALVLRLSWYYPTERFSAFFFFPALVVYVLIVYDPLDILFLVYGLLVNIFILFQGQHYWKLKLYRLTGKSLDQKRNLALFRKFRKANVLLIVFMPVFFIIQLVVAKGEISAKNLLGIAMLANVFAVLEHINYYLIQLMIDNVNDLKYILRNRKLKRASLAKDLLSNEI